MHRDAATMLGFHLSCDSGPAVLHLTGELVSPEDCDVLKVAFAFMQADYDLIIELSELADLDVAAAELLHDELMRRAAMAESVMMSPREHVLSELVRHNVDRVCPIVPTIEEETARLDRSSAKRRQPH